MSQETVTLAARQQTTVPITGRFFTVLSATAKFKVDIGGRRREVRAGSKLKGDFTRLSFIETEGVANSIVFDAGDEEYEGEVQVSGVSGDTFDYPYQPNTPNSNGTQHFNGSGGAFVTLPLVITISGVKYTRKSFHLCNNVSGPDLGIHDSTGNLLDIHINNTERTFFFTQDVKVRSVSTTAIDSALFYTLYKTPPQ